MLVRFIVSNFLSFAEEQEFLMIPGKGLQKTDSHIITTGNNINQSLLKSSIIYGPNASGKSNLFEAVSEAKSMIVSPPATKGHRYSDNRFKLDNIYNNKAIIPIFSNVFLEYNALEDFGKYLDKIEILELPFFYKRNISFWPWCNKTRKFQNEYKF